MATSIPLQYLYHVTHIDNAVQIIKDKKLIPRLVYDSDNELRTRRVEVVWFSYKEYDEGYNFGSIRFCIDVKRVFIGKNFYYVGCSESKTGVVSHKILVSSEEYTDLRKYNFDEDYFIEKEGDYYIIDTHKLNIHFLFEEQMSVSNFKSIDFVEHREATCKLEIDNSFKYKCKEKGKTLKKLSSWFIAKIIINEIKIVGLNFKENLLLEAFNYLQKEIKKEVEGRKVEYKKEMLNSSMAEAKLILNLVLQYYTESKITEMCSIISLFQSFEDFISLFKLSVLKEENLIEHITGKKFEGYPLFTFHDKLEDFCGIVLLVKKTYSINYQMIKYVEITNDLNKTLSEINGEIYSQCNAMYIYRETDEKKSIKIKTEIQNKIKK